MKLAFFCACIALLFTSCILVKQNGAVFDVPYMTHSALTSVTVEAVVDYAVQNDIAAQCAKTVEILLTTSGINAGKNSSAEKSTLAIKVQQRMYLHGIEPKNALYLSAQLIKENGGLAAAFTLASDGKENIVSAIVQQKLLNHLFLLIKTTQKKALQSMEEKK